MTEWERNSMCKKEETLFMDGDAWLNPSMLRNMRQLKRIVVSPENKRYTSLDGVLYTRDLTKLVCYPAGKPQTEYAVLPTVREIGEYAFQNAGLRAVWLGAKVERLGDCAFVNCRSLERIDLPDSVQELGQGCFDECERIRSFHIPRGLRRISMPCFPPEIEAFTVAAENACYAERDGVLFSKDFSVLYACPKGEPDMEYAVADTVVEIADYAFSESRLGSIALPPSVKKVGTMAFWEMRGRLLRRGDDPESGK